MHSLYPHYCCCSVLFLVAGICSASEPAGTEFFEARIRPVLIKHCYECHSADAKQVGGEFLLDSREGLREGGESGDAIEPGSPESSLLVSALHYDGLEMPPSGKLPERTIADFETWIQHGALDPRDSHATHRQTGSQIDIEAGRRFWSFQKPRTHTAPSVEKKEWPLRKIDVFVLARLEGRGLSPTHSADRRTLIRRLSFDLTGLPPTPESVERFLADTSIDAYEQLVDRLMARPQFGERWARLWLDVARYAEDQAHIVGKNTSLFYPNAYLYRDWLIRVWNDDMPFDEFTKLQLAADLIVPEDASQQAALGFLGLGPKYYRRNAPEVMADEWEDRVDTVTRGFLGITLACARCHDHKYDPFATEDYYALAGVFANTRMFNRPLEGDAKEEAKKPSSAVHVVKDIDQPADIPVHIRGDAFNQGQVVARGYPRVLSSEPVVFEQGSGRQELANSIASADNPLTARVIVNRVWGQYFGSHLVSTPSNFGTLGGRPSHPQLLDDLAARFIANGWSLKWLHREIVLSATYRQTSSGQPESVAKDPSNVLLGRMNHRRLSIEMWRDAMLSVTAELDSSIGGESAEVSDSENRRRSVYAQVSRLELNPLLQMFDFPDPNVHAASRSETVTPLQKLFAMNSKFMVDRASRLVERLAGDCPDATEPTKRIRRAFELVYARHPSDDETTIARNFLRSDEHWHSFAHALLASNEMSHVD